MGEAVNTVSGEIVEDTSIIPVLDQDTEIDVFAGISSLPVTREQSAILLADADPNELNILPTGEIYPPQVNVRLRLIRAFGPGAWALRPLGRAKITGTQIVQEWALYVNSRFIAYTIGGADYQANNSRLNWSDATESLKSNALVRCCKDLGMFHECWDGRWTSEWKKQYAVKVWVKNKDGNSKPQWRRLDADPFYGETGITDDSPNKDKYKRPAQPQQGQKTTTPAPQKPTPNGSAPQKPQPVVPTPPTPTPTVAPKPERVMSEYEKGLKEELKDKARYATALVEGKLDIPPEQARVRVKTAAEKRDDEIAAALGVTDELPIQKKSEPTDAKVEKPQQEVQKPVTVELWNGKNWQKVDGSGTVSAEVAAWFTGHFIGETTDGKPKGFKHPNEFTNHLKRYYKFPNGNPRTYLSGKMPMANTEFAELVRFSYWKRGDNEHGGLSLPRYQDRLVEGIDNLPKPDVQKPTPEPTEKHDVAALTEKGKKLGVDVLEMAKKAFPLDDDFNSLEDYSDAQRNQFWGVLEMVEHGQAKADDIDGLAALVNM